jgi:hypothetical protein
MYRRSLIAHLPLLAALVSIPFSRAFAHTPYRFWDVFRKRNLQILTSHADYTGDDLGDNWVAVLREGLPLSRAMVSRAHDMPRIASLLKTNQVKLAVLSYMHARLLFTGAPPFEEFAPLPLEILVDNGSYLLLTRPDLPLDHGYLITAALMEEADKLTLIKPGKGQFGMAVHAGAKAFFNGEKLEPPKAP